MEKILIVFMFLIKRLGISEQGRLSFELYTVEYIWLAGYGYVKRMKYKMAPEGVIE